MDDATAAPSVTRVGTIVGTGGGEPPAFSFCLLPSAFSFHSSPFPVAGYNPHGPFECAPTLSRWECHAG